MELIRTIELAAEAASDKKAFDIVALDVSQLTAVADVFFICSAASERQVDAVVDEIGRRLAASGRRPLHVEGTRGQAQWVLMDYGDLVIHVFTEERRAYYALEKLWADAETVPLPLKHRARSSSA